MRSLLLTCLFIIVFILQFANLTQVAALPLFANGPRIPTQSSSHSNPSKATDDETRSVIAVKPDGNGNAKIEVHISIPLKEGGVDLNGLVAGLLGGLG